MSRDQEAVCQGKPGREHSMKTKITSVQKSARSKYNQSVYGTNGKAIYYISNPISRRQISNSEFISINLKLLKQTTY